MGGANAPVSNVQRNATAALMSAMESKDLGKMVEALRLNRDKANKKVKEVTLPFEGRGGGGSGAESGIWNLEFGIRNLEAL